MHKIKFIRASIYDNIFNGFIIEDEAGEKYKMTLGMMINALEGSEIVSWEKKRIYRHITKLNWKGKND